MATFDKVSGEYKDKSLVQQKAALKLFDLLKIKKTDDIIDIACGPGNITAWLAGNTGGKVIGIDISKGMIKQARDSFPRLEFTQVAVEDMDYAGMFDVAFCNSAFQWFTRPDSSIQAIFRALKPAGRLGIGCPATNDWAPWFAKIISGVSKQKKIKPVFARWKSPWFQLPLKNDYKILFEKNGFKTVHLEIDYEETYYTVEQAYNIYISGAANGFTGRKYYDIKISDNYIDAFNGFARQEIKKLSSGGRVRVDFNRLYYVGEK